MFRKEKSTNQIDSTYLTDTGIEIACTPLLELCDCAARAWSRKKHWYRQLLRRIHTEATAVEELIDNCGAQHSKTWYPFREAVAAVKRFSGVCYDLLHIQSAIPRYRLIRVEGDFYRDTAEAIEVFADAFAVASRTLLFKAKQCGLRCEKREIEFRPETGSLPQFDSDRKRRHVRDTGETIVYLSTAFLNLSTDRDVANVLKQRDAGDYAANIPKSVNEENLRLAEARFHNLQSHYDTYIFETNIENRNSNLPILRGHISVIYHLLEIATNIVHYYERHMSEMRREMAGEERHPLTIDAILRIVFDYLLGYAGRYMRAAIDLCRSMIQGYSEHREITVPIPSYRGFHVRPSTLIARIVAHYGSSVMMTIDQQEYNAGVVLDLFRANERINALKRREIAAVLEGYIRSDDRAYQEADELTERLQFLFLELANNGRIILYDTKLPFDELEIGEDETFLYVASRYIAHYMSTAKIDVESSLTADFEGDNRALIDIRLLAGHGYGEDRLGNNIVLPEELSYLRS